MVQPEEALRRLTSDPGALTAALGEPKRGGITKLYHDEEITIRYFHQVLERHMGFYAGSNAEPALRGAAE